MNKDEYKKLYGLETTYWWHRGRKAIVKNLLNKHLTNEKGEILDVGCGTGETTKMLASFGKVHGIDKSAEAVSFCKKRGLKHVMVAEASSLPYNKNTFLLATMLDLLEHIKNDSRALKESFRVIKPGGLLLITAPAWQFLWSEHDRALNHKRRYSKKTLSKKVKSAGFEIEKISFAITILFPPIVTWRLFQKAFIKSTYPKTSYVILPKWLNNFFINLLRLEAKILQYINLPLGASLICIARKPKESNSQLGSRSKHVL